ncbi:hypothetical protein INT44_004421 [Umbelopsis vinacea]|uniref:DH domain-containing protein n=1 Tax=Umbelopsis vinacea TaxID=44442 RepID=A0A8H7USI0_9FUNG|nr:hypothetical protein INT44_004421 [Umbelopsis vinacea]
MDTSKRNSTTNIDIGQLDALSELRLTVSRRHSDVDLPDSPTTDDEHSSPTTPKSTDAPYPMSEAVGDVQDKLGSDRQSKFKRAISYPLAGDKPVPVRSNTAVSSKPCHSKLCRYFCSEENSSLCPSKQTTQTPNSPTPTAAPKNKSFKRSLFSSKSRRPVSAILTPQKPKDETPHHTRTHSGGDESSIMEPTPSLDRSSSSSSTLSSHGSFHSDRLINALVAGDLSPVTDTDSGSETTLWSDSNAFTAVVNSAPVSAASSPKLNPMESQRKGFFAKRANTQPVMTIDVRPGKGLKAALRNKREAAVLKREAKAITIWRTSTLTLLEAGPDESTFAELNKKFMDPMLESAKLGSPLVRSQDLPILFAHLADAIKISTQIIDRFEKCKEESGMLWRKCPLRVGRIFKDLNDDMGCYVKYALDYHSFEKVLKRAVRNVEYQKFNQDSINNLETNRMGLADYLIMPIQRVTRYGLLLKDLKKHTSVANPDYDDLDGAIKMITGLAIAMNHAQKKN